MNPTQSHKAGKNDENTAPTTGAMDTQTIEARIGDRPAADHGRTPFRSLRLDNFRTGSGHGASGGGPN